MVFSFLAVAVTSVFFVVVALAFYWEGSTAPTRRVRNLGWLASGLSVQFAVGAAWSAGIEAADLGWITSAAGDYVKNWLGLTVEVIALGLGLTALVVVARSDSALHKATRMTAILSARIAHVGSLSDLRLTARELQVLELMSIGVTSDRDLATGLSISAATAATHVRNIMQKAGVSRRHDLLLLGGVEPEDDA